MRLVIATPVYRHIAECAASRARAIACARLAGHEVLALSVPHPGGATSNRAVLDAYATMRDVALLWKADALVAIEDDMIIPQSAIVQLLDVDADIAYALYAFRWVPHFWSAYWHLEDDGGASAIDVCPADARAWFRARAIVEVRGVGMGCTVIQRRVLERIAFRLDEQSRAAPDWWLAYDARRAGFAQACHFGVVCGHVLTAPSLTALYPDPDAPGDVRRVGLDAPPDQIDALRSVYA